jgi:hypothetical protein
MSIKTASRNKTTATTEPDQTTTATAPAPKPTLQIPQGIQRSVVESFVAAHSPRFRVPEDWTNEPVPNSFEKANELWVKWSPVLRRFNHSLSPEIRQRIIAYGKAANVTQQGLGLTVVNHIKAALERHTHLCAREKDRNDESFDLRAALESNFAEVPLCPMREIPEPLCSYILTDGAEVAGKLRAALAAYQIRRNELFSMLYPKERLEEHKLTLHSNPSKEKTDIIIAEAAVMNGLHFPELSRNARVEMGDSWRLTVAPQELALIEGAIIFVNRLKQQAIDDEHSFFATYSLPHEATSVSRHFDAILADLEHTRKRLAGAAGGGTFVWDASRSVLESVFAVPLT